MRGFPNGPNPRLIGWVHLSYVVIAGLGEVVLRRVVMSGNPAATAINLLAHEGTYRAGFGIGLVANLVYLALVGLYYRLLKPVDATIGILMAFFGMVGCTVQIAAGILQLAPLVILRDGQLASVMSIEQLRALGIAPLRIYSQAFTISFALFALFDFFLGCLIFRSGFLPRFIGILMIVAGLTVSVVLFVPLASALKFIVPVGGLAEVALMFWLIIRGTKPAAERAAPAGDAS